MDFNSAKICFQEQRKVKYDGIEGEYIFSQLVFRHDKSGKILTEGGLLDKNANSISFVDIKFIHEV